MTLKIIGTGNPPTEIGSYNQNYIHVFTTEKQPVHRGWWQPIDRSPNPQSLFYLNGTTWLIDAAVGHVAGVMRFCALGSGGGGCSTSTKWWWTEKMITQSLSTFPFQYSQCTAHRFKFAFFQLTGYGGSLPEFKVFAPTSCKHVQLLKPQLDVTSRCTMRRRTVGSSGRWPNSCAIAIYPARAGRCCETLNP